MTLSPLVARPGLSSRLLPLNREARGGDVVESLEGLRRQSRGPRTVARGRRRIHSRSRLAKAYLAGHPSVVAEDLPPYAPRGNPDERSRYGRLAGLAAWDADEPWGRVVGERTERKFRPGLSNSFVRDAGPPPAG